MNVMRTSTGRRGYSVENFKEAVGDQSLVFACDSSSDASAPQKADKAFIVPRVDQEDYVDTYWRSQRQLCLHFRQAQNQYACRQH
jgi:carbamoyl-phosphate synthase large subunit